MSINQGLINKPKGPKWGVVKTVWPTLGMKQYAMKYMSAHM